jgi:hypothetical protein
MPQINSGKSPPWVSGEIVTAAGLNGMIDAATLDPSAVTAQSDFPTLTGDEYALIVDPVSGQLKKTQLKNSLLAGNAIETNIIEGHNIGNSTLSLVAGSQLPITCNELQGLPNTGIEIFGNGVPVKIKSTLGGYGTASSGGLIFESAAWGIDFSSTNNGTVRFSQRTLFNTTGAIKLPVGTTAQRPATPVVGDLRFNTTTSNTEFYNGSAWKSSDPISAVSLTANGYVKLTNGLTMQWGRTNVLVGTYGASEVVFPVAFTTACLNLQITLKQPQDYYTANGYGFENSVKVNGTPTTTGFGYSVHYGGEQGQASYAYWFAIGY